MADYDASIRINTNISPDKMNSYEINTESFERLNKNIERLKQSVKDSFNPQFTKMSMEILNQDVQESFSKLFSVLRQYDFEEMLKDFRFSVNEMADAMNLAQIKTLQNIDFSRVFRDSFYREKYDEASDMAFEYAEGEVKGEENISQEELLEVFNAQMEDEAKGLEKLRNKSKEFKEKYNVFCEAITWIFTTVITAIITASITFVITYALGKITSEPKEDAPVVNYFDQRTEINIIGETDSYYLIIYPGNDGNGSIGYCKKGNVEFVPIEDDENVEGGVTHDTER